MLAIIPARGGSKGLPNKNIKLLNGKPLIAYTIEAALKANGIDRIIVSTDDEHIASISREYGAEVPFMRPDYLATDTAKTRDTILYTLDRLSSEGNNRIDEFLLLQPTSPLRTSDDIDAAINLFRDKEAGAVVSYCKEYHPIRWHKYVLDDGKVESIFNHTESYRQAERPSYFPNGSIYIYKMQSFLNEASLAISTFAFLMPRIRSIDIDTLEDFEYCEFLMK